MENYDVIVIGAGQNGLTAAAYMAKAGLKVVVLEKEEEIGGSVITREITAPGFKHDVASTGFTIALGNPAIHNDELELISKYGLDLIPAPDGNVVTIFEDGTTLTAYTDVEKTCAEIATISERDADAYREFVAYVTPFISMLNAGQFVAPPRLGMMFNQLDQNPIGQELLRLLFMSAWDLVENWFENDKVKMWIANYATEAMVHPEENGSAYYIVALVATQHIPGGHMSFGRGGIRVVPDSLARCIEDHGGTILTNKEIVKTITENGKAVGVETVEGEVFTASKAIIANVDPRISINQWLDETAPIEPALRKKIDQITEPSFSGLMTHVALDKEPEFKAGGRTENSSQMMTMTTDVLEFRKYFSDIRMGLVPDPAKMLIMLPGRLDPSRMPEGKSVLYLWAFYPYFLNEGGAEEWDNIKEEISNNCFKEFCNYTTNITEADVLGKHIISPLDFERTNMNRIHGQITGPSAGLHQFLSYRPVPELGQYRTPVEGYYLSGQAMHPGGAITLGGRATAQIVMEDLGIDFDDVIS